MEHRQNLFTHSLINFCIPFCILAVLSFGCGKSQPVPLDKYPGHSVVLISIDTCRADYIQPFGAKAKTPNLLQLSQDSVRFPHAVTTVPLTVPAHASLFTGLYPIAHGIRDNFASVLPSKAVTMAERFQEAGYKTSGIIGAILLSTIWGFSQGFDDYNDEFTAEEFQAKQPAVERNAERVTALALEWLAAHQAQEPEKPFFLFVHYYDPHTNYIPPAPYDALYQDDLYAGEIAYTDHNIGRLISYLKEQQLYDESIIVLTGDHGEGLGDHGEASHGLFLYEESIRVPFLIKLPLKANRRNIASSQQVCLTDLFPTLADLCDLNGLDSMETDGISLRPWLMADSKTIPRELLIETQYPLVYNWSPLFALRSNRWKYIHAPQPELYALRDDAEERHNLFADKPAKAEEMQAAMEELLLRHAPESLNRREAAQFPSERMEKLTALGYVGGVNPNLEHSDTDQLPDPKEMLDIHLRFERGLAYLAENRIDDAKNVMEELKEKDPENPSIYFQLGKIYSDQKEWQRAKETFHQALEHSPDNLVFQLQLAWVLIQLQEYPQSHTLLLRLISQHPKLAEANYMLGIVALEQNKANEAISYFIRTEQFAPNYPGLKPAKQRAVSLIKKVQGF